MVDDEDMTASDITTHYKMSSFIYLYNDFWYSSLGSTCTCHYLIIDSNMSQTASPSKLNFRYIDSPIMLYWEGHNSSIRNEIEANEHLMESLFDKLSNRSSPTLITSARPSNYYYILSLFLPRTTISPWTCFLSL
jgi:hypothetical protein